MKRPPITNAFSVDVEDYFHVSAYAGVIERSEWEGLPSRVHRNTRKLLDLTHYVTKAYLSGTIIDLDEAARKRSAAETSSTPGK